MVMTLCPVQPKNGVSLSEGESLRIATSPTPAFGADREFRMVSWAGQRSFRACPSTKNAN